MLIIQFFAHTRETSKRWIVDRATLHQARLDDMQYVDDPEHLEFLGIYFANCEEFFNFKSFSYE